MLEFMSVASAALQFTFNFYTYRAKWNSQIASFETFLNEQYSLPYVLLNRATLIGSQSIIWIENTAALRAIVLYNKIESRPPVVLFNKYKPANPYALGEYCSLHGTVYKSKIAGNTGNLPSSYPGEWELVGLGPVLWNRNDPVNSYDFIVWVPATLVYDPNILNSQIMQYKIAGKRYTINTY